MSRKSEFETIKKTLSSHIFHADERTVVFNDDAIQRTSMSYLTSYGLNLMNRDLMDGKGK